MRQFAYHRERRTRRISGIVTNNGTAAISKGSGFTISRGSTGVVTITFTQPGRDYLFANAIVINATAATGHFAKISAFDQSAVTVRTFVADATDGVPADVDFAFEILLKDASV